MGLAAINVLYMYPYYKALEQGDTSNVVALFSLSQLFVPILAFIFVGEVLAPMQYLGVLLIMVGGIALSLQKGKRIPLNAAFWWMLLCAFILSFEYILYKIAFASVNWVTGFTWPVLLTFAFSMLLLIPPRARKNIVGNWPIFTKRIGLFGVEEATTFLGIAASTYALTLAPVTLVKAIISTEPAFVLLLALLFSRRFPDFFRERIDYRSVRNKLLLFVVIGAGLLLALDPSLS